MKRMIGLMALTVLLSVGSFAAPKRDAGKNVPPVEKVEKMEKNVLSYQFALKEGANEARLYVPYPATEAAQDISNVRVSGNYATYELKKDERTGASYLYASWEAPQQAPRLTFSFSVDSHFKKGPALKEGGSAIPDDVKPYLAASSFMPCNDEQIMTLAKEAVGDADTILQKARAIYEWTIANTFRNPITIGCGLGMPLVTLNDNGGGGKCADISSVFVALLRAEGVPAREVFGLRIAGTDGDVTPNFHCWVEFYLPGTGWVQADPADVRKAMLEKNLALEDTATKEWTEFFWNGDNLFRIILSRADYGLLLDEAQDGETLEYFMYPFGVVDGTPLDYFDYKSFAYSVSFKS